MPVEKIVTEHQGRRRIAKKFRTDQESLRQSVWARLFRIRKMHSKLGAITQQTAKSREVVWRGDDQYLANPCQHQHGNRIIDHRLVIDRHQLLADSQCQRMEARSGASGEDDSFAFLR